MEQKIFLKEKKVDVDMQKFSGFNLMVKENKSRVKNFHIKLSIYVLPAENLAKKIFNKFHSNIGTICPHTREFWIPFLRKIVTSSSQHQKRSAELRIKH